MAEQKTLLRRGEESVIVTSRIPLRVMTAVEQYQKGRHLRSTAEAVREILETFADTFEAVASGAKVGQVVGVAGKTGRRGGASGSREVVDAGSSGTA